MILETERLILRPWEESDAVNLYGLAKDPAVGPAAGWPVHTSVDNSREIIRTVLSAPETYAVCLKEDNKAIGSVGLMIGDRSNLKLSDAEGEIGYWIGVPYWGRGYIPEAVREIIRRAFAELRLETLWCGYFDGNDKSRRVQEKCGFVYHHTNENIYRPLMDMTLTEHITRLSREEWMRGFLIRRLEAGEIPRALDLAWKVFLKYEAPVYEDAGTEEFRSCLHDEAYLNGIEYYGSFFGKEMVGMLGIRPSRCHICFLFVEGRYHRLGQGRALVARMLSDYEGKTVTLNASPYGVPFYKKLGFTPSGEEQTVNGIRFTPMIYRGTFSEPVIVKLSGRRDLKEKAAEWFAGKWSVPEEAYLESIEDSFSSVVPSWYLCLDGDRIAGGMGVIENDFHDRPDLSPNVCAVFTEPPYRNRGIAGRLLNYVCDDMASHGIETLYLLTCLTGFYERYGWEFYCTAFGDGEDEPSRMYIHRFGHTPVE